MMIGKACMFLALLACPALAETGGAVGAAKAKVDCSAAMSQVEMTYCAELDWNAADGDLNTAYAKAMVLMKGIDAANPPDLQGAAAALRDAQRAWLPFRDKACAAEGYLLHGGTGETLAIYTCRARLTRARTDDLRALAQEG